jgi:hypothetical protein
MKKIFVVISAMLAVVFSVSAQEKQELKQYKKDVYKSHHKGANHMDLAELNLTEDQKKQLKSNREEFRTKMQALDKEENITVKEMKTRKAALHKEQKAKNDAIFTPEQKEKIAKAKLKHEEEAKQHAEKRLERMKTELSLTDDQVAKLKIQDENTRSQMKAIRDNESLDHSAKREQMMALMNTAKEQRKAVLTQDQLKKMEESKKDHKNKESRNSR